MDAAAGLAILLREVAADSKPHVLGKVRDDSSAPWLRTSRRHRELAGALFDLLEACARRASRQARLGESRPRIVITDEQSHGRHCSRVDAESLRRERCAVSARRQLWQRLTHIDGWSERVVDYIAATESESAE